VVDDDDGVEPDCRVGDLDHARRGRIVSFQDGHEGGRYLLIVPACLGECLASCATGARLIDTRPGSGQERNWIATVPGRGWFPIFSLYGPHEPFYDKTWERKAAMLTIGIPQIAASTALGSRSSACTLFCF
jgi:hypothetical protein